ncbi:hypothetical protein BDV96DRAFT_35320 [Lophiotrema nucula]|uniref:Fungal N-terminal domain-containing protein n=1 Tax=Lophiotrema nucula TaxID=690887 RepID=A0A6A5ZEN9_9PLEO|nr:hypothetical protein BDV96DRAFT_35320 [Lophiotrema nucula]
MAFSISIGDVILLSTLAYRLGRTLTVDRRKAPTAAKEVQNQLFAVGEALGCVARSIGERKRGRETSRSGDIGIDDGESTNLEDEAIEHIVENCRETLEQLSTRMSKYAIIQSGSDVTSEPSEVNKWRTGLKTNWRKIRWMMDTEELDTARKNLSVHIDSLNLLLTGVNQDQTSKIGDRLGEIHSMITDVHQWAKEDRGNLNPAVGAGVWLPDMSMSMLSARHGRSPTFALSAKLPMKSRPLLLCPKASFKDDWAHHLITSSKGSTSVFQCNCEPTDRASAREVHGGKVQFTRKTPDHKSLHED